MKYKVGDKARIKTLDWYNANKDEDGNVVCLYSYFDKDMSEFCNKIVTIKALHGCHNVKAFRIIEDDGYSWWSDDMIEELVKEEMKSEDGLLGEYEELTDRAFKGGYEKCKSDIELNGFQLPEGYIFKDENGNEILTSKIILEKKKKEVTYPKTYEECCEILGGVTAACWSGYKCGVLGSLNKLLICRDAYWKIAGEEMGLGKPWKLSIGTSIYYIYYNRTVGTIKKDYADDIQGNVILAFPTEEMRDAFYDNFKELIESCKELL